MRRTSFACSGFTTGWPSGPLSYPRKRLNGNSTCPSASSLRFPHLQFSDIERLSSWASDDMMVMSSSPFPSKVQMFSFSK